MTTPVTASATTQAADLADLIREALWSSEAFEDTNIERIADTGWLTTDVGLEVTTDAGTFLVTVQRVR